MHQIVLVAALVASVGASTTQSESPPLWAGLVAGTHAVGYRRIEGPRGVVDLWYPTSERGVALRFADYLGEGIAGLRSFLSSAAVSSGTTDSLLASRLYAVRDVRAASGPFPLVLIAHGNAQDVTDQVVLCEFLASHGFAVAATPSPMVKTPMRSEEELPGLAERQADDLAAAIGVVETIVRIDSARVTIIGHSFGARSALLLAMRATTPRLKAFVSLDGGIGTPTALEIFRHSPSFRADAPLPPVLHFSETLDAFMAPDFTLLKSLHTPALVLESTTDLHHVHFTTWGFAAAAFPDIARVTRATPKTRNAVRDVSEKTLAFLRRAM